MPYTAEQIAAALTASARTWDFRYELVAVDGSVRRELDVVSCTIAANPLAEKSKRTAQLVLRDVVDVDLYRDRVRPYCRLLMSDGGWHEWAVGTFLMSASGAVWRQLSTGEATTTNISVDGFDMLQVLAEDAVLQRYTIAAGTNYRTAIANVLAEAGFATSQIASTDLVMPAAMEWAPGTSRLVIVNALLAAIDFDTLSADVYGVPYAGPRVDPATATPAWTYATDRSSVIIPGVDVDLDLTNVPNAWIAVVSEPDRPELLALYVNDDPASPTSTVNRGRTIVRVLGNDRSTTSDNLDVVNQDVLDAKVAAAAAADSSAFETAKFSTGLMPIHSENDVCVVDYGNGVRRFQHYGWSMQLRAGGAMSHDLRRVVQL